jgi:signal transduction histidine kinase
MASCRDSTPMAAMPPASAAGGIAESITTVAKHLHNPIGRARIEKIISRVVGGFGLVFGVQALPMMLAHSPTTRYGWSIVVDGALFGGISAVVLASALKRGVALANGFVAISYFLALVLWPTFVTEPHPDGDGRPWLWYLCTVATACAVVAFSVRWAALCTIAAPVVFGVVRTLPSGGSAGWELAVLDAVYAIILGGVVLVIITMLRQAASAVDAAQSAALNRYSTVVRQHARENERVHVDAIVHDSVLTTLLSAAFADGAHAQRLAATMANDAISHLQEAKAAQPGAGSPVTTDEIAERVRAAALAMSFDFASHGTSAAKLPYHASEAVHAAAVQAMVNSVQHAGDDPSVARTVTVDCPSRGGMVVRVADTGRGFDEAQIPEGRLGVRVSIRERIANACGSVVIEAEPGSGTVVTLRWPAVHVAPDGRGGEKSLRESPSC